jgi:hypothetical protein
MFVQFCGWKNIFAFTIPLKHSQTPFGKLAVHYLHQLCHLSNASADGGMIGSCSYALMHLLMHGSAALLAPTMLVPTSFHLLSLKYQGRNAKTRTAYHLRKHHQI